MSKENNKVLGRGLEALLGTNNLKNINLGKEEVVRVEINQIIPNPDQPRRHFDEDNLQELAVSITEFGVLQPLVVTEVEQNKYSIIAGERRWRASKIAGLSTIPVIVRSVSELEKLELALIENVQREDLTPLEQALSIQRLHDQFSMSYQEIANKLGKAYSTVANLARLLQLPPSIQKSLQNGDISEGHARTLLSLQNDDKSQQILFDLILSKHLSVRQAEQYVVASRDKATKESGLARTVNENKDTKELSRKLGYKVQLSYLAKGGKISIRFNSDDEYRKIVEKLSTLG